MSTAAEASASAALAVIEPAFSEPEKLASAGFLAGYSGQTQDAYSLDNTDGARKPDHADGDPRPAAVTFVTTEATTPTVLQDRADSAFCLALEFGWVRG